MFLQLTKTHSDSKCLNENASLAYQKRAGFPPVYDNRCAPLAITFFHFS